jgi:hypothetical protein
MTTLYGHVPLAEAVASGNDRTAAAAWRRWRSGVDIDRITWRDAQLVSMIAARRLQPWIDGDPAAGILAGLVHRNRVQSTLRCGLARRIAATIAETARCPVMLAGAVAMFIHGGGDAIRPITDIELLVPRPLVSAAVMCLARQGWRNAGPGRLAAADWEDHVALERDGLLLRLQWRHLPVPPWRSRDCEASLFAHVEPVLPREPLLAAVLGRGCGASEAIPWQVDAALVLRKPVDWGRVLAATERIPGVASRLEELRRLGLPVPSAAGRVVPAFLLEAAADRVLRRSVRAGRAWRQRWNLS